MVIILDIISEQMVPNSKAKEMIEKKEKEGELKYEQKNSLEILRKFVKLDPNKIDELVADLKKVEKLRDRQIISIVNFMPEDKEELKAVLHKDYSSLIDEEIDSVLKTVKKYI